MRHTRLSENGEAKTVKGGRFQRKTEATLAEYAAPILKKKEHLNNTLLPAKHLPCPAHRRL
jgi:hypothetical protein